MICFRYRRSDAEVHIWSTRRFVEGTPAASGNTTPSTDDQPPPESRLSFVVHGKQEAARHRLYSRFFRGPIIEVEKKRLDTLVSESHDKRNPHVEEKTITERITVEQKITNGRPSISESSTRLGIRRATMGARRGRQRVK